MNIRLHRSALLACAAFISLACIPARAQSQDATTQTQEDQQQQSTTPLKKIAVKAPVRGVAATPLATETTRETIQSEQISSFEDLGRSEQPGVGFNRTNGSVNIRGLEGARVQTTIDGIPIPYLDDGARSADGGIDSFDFDALSGLDIVRGADSSRAGDGALGGAVVLRTLQPEDLIGEGKTWGGVFKFTYDSADKSWGTSAAVATRFDNTAVLFQGGYKKGHETRTTGDSAAFGAGRTEADPADFDQKNFLLKVKQYTDTGHTFTLTGERYDRDKDIDLRSAQAIGGNYRPGFWDGNEDVKRDRLSLNYEFEAVDDDALIDAANAVFYWQDLTRDSGTSGYRYTSVIGDYARNSEVNTETFGGAGFAEKEFETGAVKHTVRLGGDFAFSTTTQYSSGIDSCSVTYSYSCNFLHTNQSDMPDVDGKTFGIYLEDEIAFGNGFSLTPGVRYDWYEQSPQETASYAVNPNYAGLPDSSSGDAFSPKLLAKYEAAQNVEFFAQWAMGFRSPTAQELYLSYGAPGSYLSIGNPDLKPETSNGFEIGATLGDDDFGGSITGFHNRYRNFIDTQSAAVQDYVNYPFGITEYVNRSRVRIYGVELSAHKRFDSGFHVNGSLTYADGKDLDSGLKLASVAPLKAVIGAGYATEVWGADLTWIGAKGVSDTTDATFKAPGYGIVDLTGWWKPEQTEGLTIRAGVYNIFDKEYYDALNVRDASLTATSVGRQFYSEPGRTFKVSLTQRF